MLKAVANPAAGGQPGSFSSLTVSGAGNTTQTLSSTGDVVTQVYDFSAGNYLTMPIRQAGVNQWRIQASANFYNIFDSNGTGRLNIAQSSGDVYPAAGAANMTGGFFRIPSGAGAPSGTPSAINGTVPMYYDSTNNKFYVYNGAWKGVVLA